MHPAGVPAQTQRPSPVPGVVSYLLSLLEDTNRPLVLAADWLDKKAIRHVTAVHAAGSGCVHNVRFVVMRQVLCGIH